MALYARLAEHRFRFTSPMGNARARWHDRSAILLTLEDESGRFGQGEAAPLPGYSEHTLESCRAALGAQDPRELEGLIELEDARLREALGAVVPHAPPEARFAVETALLDLIARRRGLPLFRLLRELMASAWAPTPDGVIALVLLLGPDPVTWASQTAEAVAAGYAGVKVKIGVPGATAEELAALPAVRAVLGPNRVLRLDANGALARGALGAYAAFSPEFVEEPFPRDATWEQLPVRVALDESLRSPDALWDRPGVVAWVLKLGPLGGFSRCLDLAREAASRKVELVVSHTFEGPVGFAAAVELALALGPGRFPAGLAMHSGLPATESSPGHRGSTLVLHTSAGLGIPRVG